SSCVRQSSTLRRCAAAVQLETVPVGTVNHELRGPLTAIKGYAATLRRHEEASERLSGVIERLLGISQLEPGIVTRHLCRWIWCGSPVKRSPCSSSVNRRRGPSGTRLSCKCAMNRESSISGPSWCMPTQHICGRSQERSALHALLAWQVH